MNRLFFLGFLFTVIASVFWGAMGTAVQHLFQIKSGFFALGLVTLRQLSAGVLFVAIGTLIMPRKMWSIFNDRKLLLEILTSGALVFLAHFCFFQSISYSNAGTAAIFLTLNPMLAGLWLTLVRGTKMSSVECICAVLAAAGVALMVTDGDFSGLKFSPMAVVWGTLFGSVCNGLQHSTAEAFGKGRCYGCCGMGISLRRSDCFFLLPALDA